MRLISAATAVGDSKALLLGLQFHLQPGWKIYWRSPGDAGVPPQLTWTGSRNLDRSQTTIAWPAPERFDAFGLSTAGYSGDVILPIHAAAITAGQAVGLQLNVQYLVCSTICVPGEGGLALELPEGLALDSPYKSEIDQFLARVPAIDSSLIEIRTLTAEPTAEEEGGVLRVSFLSRDRAFTKPDLFIEGPMGVVFDVPHVTLQEKGKIAEFSIPLNARRGVGILKTPITLTLVDTESFAEFRREPIIMTAAPSLEQWLKIILLALAGGVILNLMPCVLPVLALKVLAVANHRHQSTARARQGLLISAAGIITAFLILAGGVLVLKGFGVFVGWGIQFQQPVFLAIMALVLTLFAANLLGLYEITLPSALATRMGTQKGEGFWGQFLTGAFATFLATPCSAPFLGTAVGFSLSRGPLEVLTVFTALGIGLALPYLMIAAIPQMGKILPRPGPWMIRLRQAMGLLLLASAFWLLTVIATQASSALAFAIGALFALSFIVLVLRRWIPASRLGQRAGFIIAFLGAAAVLSPIYG
ncbi:MAG: protein-disulfide reductase DsbD family protein [Alphaproteobacteria bacterium]